VTGYDANVIPAELANLASLQKPTDARKLVKTISDICAAAHAFP